MRNAFVPDVHRSLFFQYNQILKIESNLTHTFYAVSCFQHAMQIMHFITDEKMAVSA